MRWQSSDLVSTARVLIPWAELEWGCQGGRKSSIVLGREKWDCSYGEGQNVPVKKATKWENRSWQ